MVKNLLSNSGDAGLSPGCPCAAGKLKPFCTREPSKHNEDSVQPKKKKTTTTPKHTIICNERIKKKKNCLTEPSADKNAEELGPSYTASGKVQWYMLLEKRNVSFL